MPKHQQQSSNSRALARQRFQQERQNRTTGASASSSSALDALDVDEDDVYDVVEESEYEQIVQSRRERDEFVVDDDGLGYADDGEEACWTGDPENNDNKTRRQRHANATLTDQALRKARKTSQAMAARQEAAVGNNRSMWEFVNKASTAAPSTSKTSFNQNNNNNKRRSAQKLEDLLGTLDEPVYTRPKKTRNTTQQRPPRTTTSSARSSRTDRRLPPRRQKYSSDQHDDNDNDNDDAFADFGGGDVAWDNDENNNDNNDNFNADFINNSSTKKVSWAPEDEDPSSLMNVEEQQQKDTKPAPPSHDPVTLDDIRNSNSEQEAAAAAAAAETTAAPRRKLARPKLGKVTQAAAEAARAKEQTKITATTTADTAVTNTNTTTAPSTVVTAAPLLSFQPVAAEMGASTATAGQMELADYLKQQQFATDQVPYMDLFWMDLCERNGDVYLFGKVALNNNDNKTTPQFVSACAVVRGNARNLFVLPRPEHTMADVHAEINALLHQQGIIPKQVGASWAGKPVRRSYAFGDATLPRQATQYLKVVYDSKYPLPSEEVCLEGGKHFAKILGAGASVTENFILKRKLMGPCWVRLHNPQPMTHGALSWCKVECLLNDPKQLKKLELVLQEEANANPEKQLQPLPPPPPVVTMSLKLQTVVNPKTHKSEIVAVSAVCHKNVQLDSASDESHKYMTQLSIIRPLPKDGVVATSGVPQFPRDIDAAIAAQMPSLRREPNERALLSRLIAQIGQWDPDVIVGHNAWGFDLEVLLSRCAENKIRAWSRIGRRRRTELPHNTQMGARKDHAIADAVVGRLLCDTFLSAQELLRETTYSLTNLAATQLKTARTEIQPQDVPQYFQSGSRSIVHLAQSTLFDAQLVQRLLFHLQVLPLTKQLTNIAGNMWSHTLKSNRAERTEYLLLHEFHRLKYLPPEKRRLGGKWDNTNKSKTSGNKAKFSGGLVLEPKKGLYDSFILLLDFNSLYPSIIQEYNLCFTTVDWSGFASSSNNNNNGTDGDAEISGNELPPLPDESQERGVLPRVIQSLVERRRAVKRLLKSEHNPEKRAEHDIRQQALKLTANSMYGCLGFSNSRFFAQPIAAMVTAKGRETLQRTVDIAQNSVGLEVIYGDTDSIMINTRINDESDLKKVKELGEQVKKEVNRLYRTLELEIDGIFRTMLLLKKKKYAAKTVIENADGTIQYGQELKGLDLVRRDWCIQSKDTGRYVTEQILSGQDSEVVLDNIHSHLEELAAKMRAGELPLEKYVITKGLSKHPNDYPDAKSQPHVQVAKMMLQHDRVVNTGDHIPYIITVASESTNEQPLAKAPSAAERARHPDEIARSGGALKPDIEWYLTQQILPPVSRLCEPIDGTSQQILAEKLGLDAERYNHRSTGGVDLDSEIAVDYTPASLLSDEERFKDVEKLKLYCLACGTETVFPGVFSQSQNSETGVPTLVSGLMCTNPDCENPRFWGHPNQFECYSRISNSMLIWTRGLMGRYYEGLSRCDEPGCGLETRQLSVLGGICLRRGCQGTLCAVDSERAVHTHLQYLESLFDVDHVSKQLESKKVYGGKADILTYLSRHDGATFEELHQEAKRNLVASAFNWISPSFWQKLFPIGNKQ